MPTIPEPREVEQAGSTSAEFFRGLIFELSDERAEHAARLLAAERRAYLDGYAAGYAEAKREASRDWSLAPLPRPVEPGPTLAEIRRRRAGHGPLCTDPGCPVCSRG